jgi:hypothetical protein
MNCALMNLEYAAPTSKSLVSKHGEGTKAKWTVESSKGGTLS